MKIEEDETLKKGGEEDQYPDTEEEEENSDVTPKKRVHRLRKLLSKLEAHFAQLPVVGFKLWQIRHL